MSSDDDLFPPTEGLWGEGRPFLPRTQSPLWQQRGQRDGFDVFRGDQMRFFDTPAGRLIRCDYTENSKLLSRTDPPTCVALSVATVDLPGFKTDKYVGVLLEVRGRKFVTVRVHGDGAVGGTPFPVYIIADRIPADSLPSRRAVQAAMFDKSADVLRKLSVTDSFGRPVPGAEATVHTYPCTVTAKRLDKEVEESDRAVEVGLRQIDFPYDADILATDRVRVFDLVNGARSGQGIVYQITGIQDGVSEATVLATDAKAEG